MEKFFKINVDNSISIVSIPDCPDKELDNSFNNFVHQELNCDLYECVSVSRFFDGRPYFMLVDESGLLKDKSINIIPWAIYNNCYSQAPIVGNVLLVNSHRVGELQELDFCGFSDSELSYIFFKLRPFLSIIFDVR